MHRTVHKGSVSKASVVQKAGSPPFKPLASAVDDAQRADTQTTLPRRIFPRMGPGFRTSALDVFAAHLEERRSSAEHELAALDEASANETKSSAGDKYETAREMFAQARGLQRRILEEAEAGCAWVERQRSGEARTKCGPGALVETSEGWLLLGPVPVRVDVNGTEVQGTSTQSPLGQALKGTRAGDDVPFRGKTIRVLRIL